MTALEQQLTKALRALSAQYEQAQQQHAAQVETLQQQVEALEQQVAQLSGRVTPLAQNYRTLTETLRGRWSCCASGGESAIMVRAASGSRLRIGRRSRISGGPSADRRGLLGPESLRPGRRPVVS